MQSSCDDKEVNLITNLSSSLIDDGTSPSSIMLSWSYPQNAAKYFNIYMKPTKPEGQSKENQFIGSSHLTSFVVPRAIQLDVDPKKAQEFIVEPVLFDSTLQSKTETVYTHF